MSSKAVTIAVVQAAPVLVDQRATVTKTVPDVFQLTVNRRPAPAVSWLSPVLQAVPESAGPLAAQHIEPRNDESHA